jgi:pimeloyl-ACP methyl ester carboxylesterase
MHNSHMRAELMDDHIQPTVATEQSAGTRLSPVMGATSLVALIGLALAYVAYMRRYVLHDIPLTGSLSGRVRSFTSSVGEQSYYEVRNARHYSPLFTPSATAPMLFLHSINLAASSYEVKPLYEHYAHERSVYALDMPGYGLSERGERTYTPALFRDAISDFISLELHGAPVDAVALSLSSEFLALAAEQRPELFRSLTFISPTGLSSCGPEMSQHDTLLKLLLDPRWSRIIYDTFTSRFGLKYLLQKLQRHQLDRGLLHYAYVTSHQPEAQVAPFHYLAGKLYTPDIISVYQSLIQPVLAVYGQSRRTQFDRVDSLHTKPNWRIAEFKQCGEFVHFDDPRGVIAQIDRHLHVS